MLKPQTQKPQNGNLFGNKVFADVLRMRSQQNRKDSSANVTGILTERGNLDTDMHTGSTLCEDKCRVWGDGSTSQGKPKTASQIPKVRGEA